MIIAIGCDHGGYPLKEPLAAWLNQQGHQVLDMGAYQLEPTDDYPDFAQAVALAVQGGKAQRGIILCGSGVGACVVANKFAGVRAGLCHDTYSAAQGVEHDDVNVLCLGARVVGEALALEIVKAFTQASYSGQTRHQRRLEKVLAIEKAQFRR